MKKRYSLSFLFLGLVFSLYAQQPEEDDLLGIDLFEDPAAEIYENSTEETVPDGGLEEELDIFENEESPGIFEKEDTVDISGNTGDFDIFENGDDSGLLAGDQQTSLPGKTDYVAEFFDNMDGKSIFRYAFFFELLDVEEDASPEPDNKRHYLDKHSEITTYLAGDFWRLNLTYFLDFGNQENTYAPWLEDPGARDWQDWFQDTKSERLYFKISDFHLNLFFSFFDIIIGKKVFIHSLSTLYSPADIYKATDLTDPNNPYNFGKYLVEFDFFAGPAALSLVIFPVYQGGKSTKPLSRWGYYKFKEIQDESGTTAEDLEEEEDEERHYTDITPENISYLLKCKSTLAGIDFFLAGFYGLANNSVSRVWINNDDEEEKEAVVVPVINASCGFSTTVKRFEFHAETLYNYTLASKDDDYIRYVAGTRVGIDGFPGFLPLDKIDCTLEYAGEYLFKRQSHGDYTDSTEERRGLKNDLLGMLIFQFTDKLKLLNLAQYEINDAGFLFSSHLIYQWLGNMEIDLGAQLYFTPETSNYYYWRDNTCLQLKLTYTY